MQRTTMHSLLSTNVGDITVFSCRPLNRLHELIKHPFETFRSSGEEAADAFGLQLLHQVRVVPRNVVTRNSYCTLPQLHEPQKTI